MLFWKCLFLVGCAVQVTNAVLADVPKVNSTRSRYSKRIPTTGPNVQPSLPVRKVGIGATNDILNYWKEKLFATSTPMAPKHAKKGSTECGVPLDDNQPWIIVLEHTHPTRKLKMKTLSKGVLIAPNVVLTTMSSIQNSFPFWVVSSVRLGDKPTWSPWNNTRTSQDTVRVNVSEVFLHQTRDIALLKLETSVNVTDYIRPICLPPNGNYNYRELLFHICEKRQKRAYNRLVYVDPVAPTDCHTLFERQKAVFTEENFCAWDQTGDTCTGDLGGPLMANYNSQFLLIGLNSYVYTEKEMDPGLFPGVYTRVGSHLNWIKGIIESFE